MADHLRVLDGSWSGAEAYHNPLPACEVDARSKWWTNTRYRSGCPVMATIATTLLLISPFWRVDESCYPANMLGLLPRACPEHAHFGASSQRGYTRLYDPLAAL